MTPDRNPPGVLRRLAAFFYDMVVLAAVLFAATVVLLPLNGGEAFRPHHGLYSAYLVMVSFAFFGWFWTHGGQTLGMRAWKIRLCTTDGNPISWGQALIRFACGLISFGFAGLGFLWILFDSQGRSWHDLASGSRIVWKN